MGIDKKVAVSNVLLDVVYTKDVREYIHAPLIEIIHVKFNDLWMKFIKEDKLIQARV